MKTRIFIAIVGSLILFSVSPNSCLAEVKATQKILKIAIQKGNASDEACVRFRTSATTCFDGSYDAYKMFSSVDSMPQLYTLTNCKEQLSINSFGDFTSDKRVTVGLRVGRAGNHTIIVSMLSNFAGAEFVYLIDKTTGEMIDLKSTDMSYDFYAPVKGVDTSRFELLFTAASRTVTETEEQINTSKKELICYNESGTLVINNLSTEGITNLQLTDLSGKVLLFKTTENSEDITIKLPYTLKGMYVLQISNNQSTMVKKLMF